ncbi:hypothetical protein [Sediminibacillus massiliensis]|nr:hypothetical protein [Sediminibacillus massiliensis]
MTMIFTKGKELMEKDYLQQQAASLQQVSTSPKVKRKLFVFKKTKTKK